jgi:hypothetical protein
MASALIVSAQNGQALSPCEFDATPGSGTAGDSGAAAAGVALLGKSATMSPNGPKKSPIKNHPNPLRPFEDATTALKTAKSNAKKRISIAQTPHCSFVHRAIPHPEHGDTFKPSIRPAHWERLCLKPHGSNGNKQCVHLYEAKSPRKPARFF